MATVAAGIPVSLDGFVADLSDGAEHVFAWYSKPQPDQDAGRPGAGRIESAMQKAKQIVPGNQVIALATPSIIRQCLNLDLVDGSRPSSCRCCPATGSAAHLDTRDLQQTTRSLRGDRPGWKTHAMIYPLLTYLDMQPAMAELADVFGLEVVWLGNDAAEIRWNGGVAVAQTDQPEMLHGSHVGHEWTYVRVADPDAHYARSLSRGAHVLNEPHSGPDGQQRGYSAGDREGNVWTFAIHKFGR